MDGEYKIYVRKYDMLFINLLSVWHGAGGNLGLCDDSGPDTVPLA